MISWPHRHEDPAAPSSPIPRPWGVFEGTDGAVELMEGSPAQVGRPDVRRWAMGPLSKARE